MKREIKGDKGHLRDKQTVLPLEKGEIEGDGNPLNPNILRTINVERLRSACHTNVLYLPLSPSNSL